MKGYKLLRVLFRKELWEYRGDAGDTQERMAEKLHISPRSYSDLEHGKYGVSTVSLLLFPDLLPDEKIIEVVRKFVTQAQEENEHEYIV